MAYRLLYDVALLAAAYLLGSIPFGLVLSRLFAAVDIRRHGSGNIGATNVARIAGWPLATLTLIGDVLKGFLPVYAASALATSSGPTADGYLIAVALAALMGHLFPLYLKFKTGGKGVATAAGAFLALSPPVLLVALVFFAVVVLVTRRVSAGSLSAALTLPIATWWATGSAILCAGAVVVTLFIFGRHRANIGRLLTGTEPVVFGSGKHNKSESGGGAAR